ncbi:Mitotic exit network component [Chamberlinius hualienensis]
MSGCPDMIGAGQRQYQWYDEKGKKCKVAAPQYVDYVMTFTQKTINDECIFPSKSGKFNLKGNEFPSSFESIVKKINRLLFHVLAHVYYAHFKELLMLGLHSHLNCLFAHVILFNERFKQIDDNEIEILDDLIVALKLKSDNSDLNEPNKSDESDNSEKVHNATTTIRALPAATDGAIASVSMGQTCDQQQRLKDGMTSSSSVSSTSSSTTGTTTTSELASLSCDDVKWQQQQH